MIVPQSAPSAVADHNGAAPVIGIAVSLVGRVLATVLIGAEIASWDRLDAGAPT